MSDPDLFRSCWAVELDPDPKERDNQDPNPNKVGSDPQHWVCLMWWSIRIRSDLELFVVG